MNNCGRSWGTLRIPNPSVQRGSGGWPFKTDPGTKTSASLLIEAPQTSAKTLEKQLSEAIGAKTIPFEAGNIAPSQ